MATPSQVPSRLPAGLTSDPPYGPLADAGCGNPFFYHQFEDDFDNSLGATGLWVVSSNNGGTVADAAGDGGLALFTTGATATNYAAIQLPFANFSLPQGALAGKKLFFLTRLQLSDVVNAPFIAGLVDKTATIFTAITDGVYFNKTSAGVLNLVTVSGSVALTWAIPAAAYNLVNNTNIDLGFYIDRLQNINVFVGSQLVGWIPQSGTGGVNSAGVASLPVVGRSLQVVGPGQPVSGNQVGPWTVSAVNLSPTLGVQSGTGGGAKTMTVDFVCAQKER